MGDLLLLLQLKVGRNGQLGPVAILRGRVDWRQQIDMFHVQGFCEGVQLVNKNSLAARFDISQGGSRNTQAAGKFSLWQLKPPALLPDNSAYRAVNGL